MSIESASLEQLRVHMEYMRETVTKLHQRLDNLPTVAQVQELEARLETMQKQIEGQSQLMTTLVNLERFAKWFAAICACIVAAYGVYKLIKM